MLALHIEWQLLIDRFCIATVLYEKENMRMNNFGSQVERSSYTRNPEVSNHSTFRRMIIYLSYYYLQTVFSKLNVKE